ncbi:interleukin-36 gamma-like isoform X2 [Erinaceus europaeus]|uniref:Interleukin-36 gamma-like isoform X2 n=1 Tax=Erinaceus europaeus TaxID=9365 RepID=A0ABM3X346_ERIEU|nr:interleukin-36 gamma-like isoform X2 [Erinaceus europaeus]
MTDLQGNPSYGTPSHDGSASVYCKKPGRFTHSEGHSTLAMPRPISMDISDLNQQVLVLQGETLVAVPRKDDVNPVTVIFMPCRHKESFDHRKGNVIYLGIQNPEMCLFCEDIEGKPILQLKAQKILDLYSNNEPVKPFLFYHSQNGRTSTFESVDFPDYFIASSEKDQPLCITNNKGEQYNTSFYFSSKL